MSKFEFLNQNMNDIFTKIYANQNLCKLLYHDVDNPLAEANITDTTVLYTDKENQKIFPYPFTPDIADVQKTVLNVVFNKFELGDNNIYFKPSNIDFIVLSHIYLWNITDGSNDIKLRPFMILNELDETFGFQRTVGLGRNIFDYADIIWANTSFVGYRICYKAWDFN